MVLPFIFVVFFSSIVTPTFTFGIPPAVIISDPDEICLALNRDDTTTAYNNVTLEATKDTGKLDRCTVIRPFVLTCSGPPFRIDIRKGFVVEIPAHYNSSSFVQIHNCSFYGRIEIAILVPHLRLLLSDVIITAFALTTAFGGCLSIETLGNVSLHNVTTVNGSSMNSGGCIFINRNGTNPIAKREYPSSLDSLSVELTDVKVARCLTKLGRGSLFISNFNDINITNLSMQDGSTLLTDGGCLCILTSQRITLSNSKFRNCNATGDGGGMSVEYVDYLFMKNVSVYNGTSGVQGGGISVFVIHGAAVLENVTVDMCSSGASGGCMYIYNFTNVAITNGVAQNCYANHTGGGIRMAQVLNTPNVVHIENVTLSNMTSQGCGGALFFEGIELRTALLIVRRVTIRNSTSNLSCGGGIHVDQWGYVYIEETSLDMVSAGQLGGGLNVINCQVFTLAYVDVRTARSGWHGGAIFVADISFLSFVNVSMENVVAGTLGGAIATDRANNSVLQNIRITHGYSGWGGGGMSLRNGSGYLNLVDVIMNEIHSGEEGGCLRVRDFSGNMSIRNTFLIACKSYYRSGGSASFEDIEGRLVIHDSTFRNGVQYNGYSGGCLRMTDVSFISLTNVIIESCTTWSYPLGTACLALLNVQEIEVNAPTHIRGCSAVDARTGRRRWSRPVDVVAPSSSPLRVRIPSNVIRDERVFHPLVGTVSMTTTNRRFQIMDDKSRKRNVSPNPGGVLGSFLETGMVLQSLLAEDAGSAMYGGALRTLGRGLECDPLTSSGFEHGGVSGVRSFLSYDLGDVRVEVIVGDVTLLSLLLAAGVVTRSRIPKVLGLLCKVLLMRYPDVMYSGLSLAVGVSHTVPSVCGYVVVIVMYGACVGMLYVCIGPGSDSKVEYRLCDDNFLLTPLPDEYDTEQEKRVSLYLSGLLRTLHTISSRVGRWYGRAPHHVTFVDQYEGVFGKHRPLRRWYGTVDHSFVTALCLVCASMDPSRIQPQLNSSSMSGCDLIGQGIWTVLAFSVVTKCIAYPYHTKKDAFLVMSPDVVLVVVIGAVLWGGGGQDVISVGYGILTVLAFVTFFVTAARWCLNALTTPRYSVG